MELKKYKLGEIATVEISGVDKKSKENEIPVKLCNFTDVYHNWAITKEMEESFMNATANQKEIECFSIKKGQVAFTKDSETRDDIGIPTYIADDFENVLLGYHTALITPDNTKLSGKYLNAFMNTAYIKKYFENNASGSGQRYTLSTNTLNDIPIIAPDLQTQIKIGDLFSKIDSKITLNRRINKKLETIAKRLYDYWFVQFDFPDANGNPYKSSGGKMVWNDALKREIPEGWGNGIIGNFIEIGNGKDHRHLQDGVIPVYGSGGLMRKVTDYLYEGESVLFPRKGTLNNVMYRNEQFWTVDTMFYSKIKVNHSAIFVYYTAKQFDFTSLNTGTGVPSMTSVIIKGLPIIYPPQNMLDKFDVIVQSFYKDIRQIEKETARLTALRDKLLPLLMNGQVEVA